MTDTTGDALALPTEITTLPTEIAPLPTETAASIDTPERLANGRFPPGFVANPRGRIPGSKNRCTQEVQALLDSNASAIGQKLVDMALANNSTALRLCVERVIPKMSPSPMNLEMPSIKTPVDIGPALSAVLDAAACGEIDTDQARGLAAVIETRRKSFETIELEERMTLIEKKISRDRRAI